MTSLDDLAQDVAELLGEPCTLEDTEFRLVAFSPQFEGRLIDEVRQRSILERSSGQFVRHYFLSHGIADAVDPVRIPHDEANGVAARLCIPVRHLGRTQGYFWVLGDHRAADYDTEAVSAIAEHAGSLMSIVNRRQAFADALYREALTQHPEAVRSAAIQIARACGVREDQQIVCVLVDRPNLAEQLGTRRPKAGVMWAREDDGLVAALLPASLLPASDSVKAIVETLGLPRWLLEDSGDCGGTRVGVGGRVGVDDVGHGRETAGTALRVARASTSSSVVSWDELGPLRLLGVARDKDLRGAVLGGDLGRFVAEGDPVLVATARAFLDEAGNVAHAAGRLAVHRQTVYQRLTQVERATGLSLSRGEDRLRLHLAVVLRPFVTQDAP